jgi:outer membrane immunogenic protein
VSGECFDEPIALSWDCHRKCGRERDVGAGRRSAGAIKFTVVLQGYKAPSELPFSWTGFYAGINGGYAWGQSSWSDPAVGANPGNFNTSGGLVGGQLGYNWQTGAVVLGIETDADWMSVKGSTAGLGGVCALDGGGQCQTQQSWVGTTRARVGYAFDRWLPYVTGGVAYGNVQAVQPTGTSTNTNVGWTAGAGLEYGIDHNWSANSNIST